MYVEWSLMVTPQVDSLEKSHCRKLAAIMLLLLAEYVPMDGIFSCEEKHIMFVNEDKLCFQMKIYSTQQTLEEGIVTTNELKH